MKILVVSDTHKKISGLIELIDNNDFDMIFHLGDSFDDYIEIKLIYDIPVFGVVGNIDYYYNEPLDKEVEVEGYKFFLTHGHEYRVKKDIRELMKIKGYDYILYGHTHIPKIDILGSTIILNPGSLSEPRDGNKPTYAVITIEDGMISHKIHEHR